MAKRQAILEAAQTLFLRQGYDGSSMDAIATEAGVSKLTVYSHFNDKESLYAAAVKARCEQGLPSLIFERSPDESVEAVLQRIGVAYIELVNSPASIALHRLLLSPSGHELPLARSFYEIGPRRVLIDVAELLQRLQQGGQLQFENVYRAAEHLLCMLKGGANFRLMLECPEPPSALPPEQHVAEVVALFIRAYRP